MDHEARIRELELQVAALKNECDQLRAQLNMQPICELSYDPRPPSTQHITWNPLEISRALRGGY